MKREVNNCDLHSTLVVWFWFPCLFSNSSADTALVQDRMAARVTTLTVRQTWGLALKSFSLLYKNEIMKLNYEQMISR